MAVKTELIGLKAANAALKRLPEFVKDEAQRTIDVTAFQVSRGAQQRVPVKTGKLKRAITWQRRPRTVSAVVGIKDPEAFYWLFVEYGTVKMSATPFLRPAAEAEAPKHRQAMVEHLQRAATKMAATAPSLGLPK